MSIAPKRRWFHVGNDAGDRSLDQQLVGLARLFDVCKGRSVLDLGCAEGLISMELVKAGATAAHGIEVVPEHVTLGRKLVGDLPVTLECADLNTWRPKASYDIVIALALLHKLKDPSAGCAAFCEAAKDLMVIRTPPKVDPWVIVDQRSGRKPHDIGKVLAGNGFKLKLQVEGTFGEVIGYWGRA